MKKLLLLPVLCTLIMSSILFIAMDAGASQDQQSTEVKKSVSDKGITLTIDYYDKKDGKLNIHYTVTSDKTVLKEAKVEQPFMDRPSFYTNNKFLNVSFFETQNKVNDHKFTGYASIDLNEIKEDKFTFTFATDRISDQIGNWKISFNAKK
jgi:hypothetical protein